MHCNLEKGKPTDTEISANSHTIGNENENTENHNSNEKLGMAQKPRDLKRKKNNRAEQLKIARAARKFKRKDHDEAHVDTQIKEMPYHCKFPECTQRFDKCSALGGHYSKSHPGQSVAYTHKKSVRESRELERVLHK